MTRLETGPKVDPTIDFLNRFSKDSDATLQRAMDVIYIDPISQRNLDDFSDLLLSGHVGVMHSNHVSLVDALAEAKKAKCINEATSGQFHRIDLVIARSLLDGEQGNENKSYFSFTKGFLNRYGINMDLAITTENDLRVRNLKRTKGLEESYIEGAPYEGVVFSNFPEGSVYGGKYKKGSSERNGIKRVRRENLETRYINALLAKKQKVVVLPTGNAYTYKLLDPETFRPADEFIPYVLGEQPEPSVDAGPRLVVGRPFVLNPGDQVDGIELMSKTAELLPVDHQGVFAKAA